MQHKGKLQNCFLFFVFIRTILCVAFRDELFFATLARIWLIPVQPWLSPLYAFFLLREKKKKNTQKKNPTAAVGGRFIYFF